jgi:hypothetical protein
MLARLRCGGRDEVAEESAGTLGGGQRQGFAAALDTEVAEQPDAQAVTCRRTGGFYHDVTNGRSNAPRGL